MTATTVFNKEENSSYIYVGLSSKQGTGNRRMGTGNGERGTGDGESLKAGIFKTGNL